MENRELTHRIIGCAYTVYNKLGFGFLESVYRRAMVIELGREGLLVEAEKPLQVFYDDHVVGDFALDLLVEGDLIVELKSVQHLIKNHEVQLVNYLHGLRKDVGLLINFGPTGVEIKRKYRTALPTDREA